MKQRNKVLPASAERSQQSATQAAPQSPSLRRDKGVGCYLPPSSVLDSRPLNPSLQEHDQNQGVECSQRRALLAAVLSCIPAYSNPWIPRSRSLAPRTRRKTLGKTYTHLPATHRDLGQPTARSSIPAPDNCRRSANHHNRQLNGYVVTHRCNYHTLDLSLRR